MQKHKQHGFTIVELLIVIVIIAILAAITVVAYNGIQNRARNVDVVSDINAAQKKLELYFAEYGVYPTTGGYSAVAYVDSNCPMTSTNRRTDWIPGISGLPQNPGLTDAGMSGAGGGCYLYISDGSTYVISAWNAKRGGPDTTTMYRRLGFREPYWVAQPGGNGFICNHAGAIGGLSGTYSAQTDFYKYSYTVSNLSSIQCNETPPSGA